MSIENETTDTETLIDPTSDSFGADDVQGATGAEDADASGAEEWGEDKPEGEDDDQDDDGEGDDEEEAGEKPESHKVPISRLKKEVEKLEFIAARNPLRLGLPGEPLYGMTPEAGLPKGWVPHATAA